MNSIPSSKLIALALPLLALCGNVNAQQAASGASTSSDNTALDTIVVTAQKRSERLQDVPATIVAISGADLARNNIETASDLPILVSGLVWSNQGMWVQPNIRGVTTTVAAIGSSSPIAIYIDGIYQPSQSGTVLDLPDIERIEVLKGPQGTLFGRNATGGAISIFTPDPSFTPTGNFEVAAGAYTGGSAMSAGHYAVRTSISGPLVDDTLAGSVSVSSDTTNGYLTDDVTGDRGGKIFSTLIRGKLLYKVSDDIRFLATAYYSYREDLTSEAGFPLGGVTAAKFYPGSIYPSETWHFAYGGGTPGSWQSARGTSLKGTFDFSAGTLTSLTGFSNSGAPIVISVASAYAPACVEAFVCINGASTTGEQTETQEFDFASKQMGMFRYVAGLFALYDRANEHDEYNSDAVTDDTIMTTRAGAIFAEATFDATDQLSFIAGARQSRETKYAYGRYYGAPYAQYADPTWNSFTPRGSIVYKWTNALNTYFTYSEGFKAGVVSGQITTAPPASPEKLKAYEVGMKLATPRYSADISAFYYDYRDLQVEVFENLVTTPQNAATAEIYGLDFDGAAKLNELFQVRLGASWLPTARYNDFPHAIAFVPPLGPTGLVTDNNYDASGARMLSAPRFTGTLSGIYGQQFAAGRVDANSSIYYSARYNWTYPGTIATSPYYVLNAQVSFTPNDSRLKYSVYGKNLNNKAYVSGALPTTESNEVYWSRPREVGVKLNYSF